MVGGVPRLLKCDSDRRYAPPDQRKVLQNEQSYAPIHNEMNSAAAADDGAKRRDRKRR